MIPDRLRELKLRYSFLLAHAEHFFFDGDKGIAEYFVRLNKDVTEMLEEIERLRGQQESSVCYPVERDPAPPEVVERIRKTMQDGGLI